MSFQFSISRAKSLRGKISYIHNSRESTACAFEDNEKGKIRILLPRSLGVVSVCVEFFNESFSEQITIKEAEWFSQELDNDVYIFDINSIKLGVGLFFYRLTLDTACGRVFGFKCYDTIGFTENWDNNTYFQLSISYFVHPAPENKYGGIMYHIFVDRFNKGGKTKIKDGAVVVDDWSRGIPEYPAYPGAPLKNNTFYGGTLWGIIDKLDFLKSFGVTILYLSPIFDAASNHKYDTGDYLTVDQMFGGLPALKKLIKEAKSRGIDIILDGVFNHTGSDSIYFNKEGNYNSLGAYQSKDSEFYSWYDFQQHPNKYTCWWGIDILPRINPNNPKCRNYFVGEGGVIDTYAKMGIAGFRLDVADELSDDFISSIKSRLALYNKESILYGEVWEDASNKIAYDTRKKYYLGKELDGVMNYPIRTGIINLLTKRDCGALHYALTDIIDNAPDRIKHMQMNLLGTHDTERIYTVLGGESSSGRSNEYLSKKRMTADEEQIGKKRLFMAYTILSTVPGIPVIFYGDEAGQQGYHDPFNRMPYPWGEEDADIIAFYRKIGSIRSNNSVYKRGDFVLNHISDTLLVFSRISKKQIYITIVNNSAEKVKIHFSHSSKSLIFNKKNEQNHTLDSFSAEIYITDKDSEIAIDSD